MGWGEGRGELACPRSEPGIQTGCVELLYPDFDVLQCNRSQSAGGRGTSRNGVVSVLRSQTKKPASGTPHHWERSCVPVIVLIPSRFITLGKLIYLSKILVSHLLNNFSFVKREQRKLSEISPCWEALMSL